MKHKKTHPGPPETKLSSLLKNIHVPVTVKKILVSGEVISIDPTIGYHGIGKKNGENEIYKIMNFKLLQKY